MNRKVAVILFLTLVSSVSCRHRETGGTDVLPFVRQVLSDTTSVEHLAVEGYEVNSRFGTIAVTGPLESASVLADYLMKCDIFDNVDGKSFSDGLDDFAGETFAVYYDLASPEYYGYFRDGAEERLREMTVRHAIAAISDNCSQNTYSRQTLVAKRPSKMLVLSSSFASAATSDIAMLFSRFDKELAVISPARALAEKGLEHYENDSRIGIWAGSDVLASGVYASVFRELAHERGMSAIDYAGYSPAEGIDVREMFFEYLEMCQASEDDMPLSVILVDDMPVSGRMKELNDLVRDVMISENPEISRYRNLLSDDCTVIGVLDAVASSCYRYLRKNNIFTHRIAYPQKTEYMIVPSPENTGEVKYIEMNNIYVP